MKLKFLSPLEKAEMALCIFAVKNMFPEAAPMGEMEVVVVMLF
jgi:hypothetical protein